MRSYFFICLLFLLSYSICGQSLIDFDTVAHYSLINTAIDASGQQADAELINVPFVDTNGVYCNGIYAFSGNPAGSLVSAPQLTAVYDSTFAVSIQFKIDSMPEMWLPVITVGDSWRYLGLIVKFDGKIIYNFNNIWTEIPASQIPLNQWNTCTIIFSASDSTAQYWLNGAMIAIANGALIRPEGDGKVSNTDYGAGWTFKGHMRNLTVMSIADQTTAVANVPSNLAINLFPNPAQDMLRISCAKETSWQIYNLQGKRTGLSGHATNDAEIDVSSLPSGSYLIVFTDGMEQESRLFVRQ